MEHLTADNFEEKTSSGTVVVDFYADWCGPCKRMAPIFEELSKELPDATFFKVNVEEAADLASRFGVLSIPTVIVFANGSRVEEVKGLMPKDQLSAMISGHL